MLYPAVKEWWIDPLADTDDPVAVMQDILRRFRRLIDHEKPEDGYLRNGCPICNYAVEMAPLDEGFRERLDQLYGAWRRAIANALKRGQQAGAVSPDVRPAEEAAFVVAIFAGIASTGKVAQWASLFHNGLRAMEQHLDSLRG